MTDTAILVQNLSKEYRIGPRANYRTLSSTLTQSLRNTFRQGNAFSTNGKKADPRSFWALHDVSFEIERGDVVGIIGRNGAGKSTLLKILSRITEPTAGSVDILGRVGSLLEVGTGFHGELSGRENIYMNGAILGMKRAEIDRKLDEIVAFAEVDQFLDTPVKHYSSGMHLRLAFAVAAHLEPEILIVDEVLAVGDATFQKKCLGKMGEVARTGRTVLLVSHQMNAIRRLCDRCIWLDSGHLKAMDATLNVVSAYEAAYSSLSSEDNLREESSNAPARFLGWKIVEPASEQPNLLTTLGPMTFQITVQSNQPVKSGHHGIALYNSDHQLMWGWAIDDLNLEPGIHEFVYTVPTLPLRPGVYTWYVSLHQGKRLLDIWYCIPELIIGTEPMTHPRDEWTGFLNVPCDFKLVSLK